MSIWVGDTNGCLWFYFNGELTQDDWDRYMDHLELHTRPEVEPIETTMIISYRSGSPTPPMRRRVAEFMRNNKQLIAHLRGNAMVTESALSRSSLIALNWLFKKPFPERVFSRPIPALRWLSEISVLACGEEIWGEIARVVPGEVLWPGVAVN
jgi:hypothetical protein